MTLSSGPVSALVLFVLFTGAPAPGHTGAPKPPPAAPPAATLTVPYTQFTLPNGLHVILHEDHTVPVITVNVWYHVGSAWEKPGRTPGLGIRDF